MKDSTVMEHIEKLVTEEERLYAKGDLNDSEIKQLDKIKVELDRYWDFLRQRRAYRNAGDDPEKAVLRSKKIVENYKQ